MNRSAGIFALGSTAPGCGGRRPRPPEPRRDAPILVVLELSGGNDGLNTVIPHADDVYHKSRPTLRVEPGKVLELDDRVGLHPSLKDLHRLGGRRARGRAGCWLSGPESLAFSVDGDLADRNRRPCTAGRLAGAAWRCTPPAGALPCRAGVDAAGRAGAEGGGPVAGQRRRVLPRQEGSSQTGNHGTTPPYGRGSPPCGRGPAPGKVTERGS